MFPYKATQYDTFMALVQAANPGLDIAPLTSDQLRALVPTSVTADSFGRDTSVRLMVRPGNSKYFGSQTVLYRRINVANYFRNVLPVTLDDYFTGSGNMTAAQFTTSLNNKYGTNFVAADFGTSFSAASGTQYSNTIASTSLCWEGTFTLKWTRSKQYIAAQVTNPVLVGRVYPGGNTFPQPTPPADFYTYNLDCSSIKTAIAAMAASGTNLSTTSGNGATLLSFLQRARPDLNLTSAQSTTQGGLSGVSWVRYTIPSANAPGANSAKFNTVLLLNAVAGSWFTGSFYLHYNA